MRLTHLLAQFASRLMDATVDVDKLYGPELI